MRQRTDARAEGEWMYGSHDGRRNIRMSAGRAAAAGAVALLAGCTSGPDTGPGPR
ncbi:hypothetical protein OH786_12055 [Streptomyces atratus]|uniref:hypothetical protein n=1 Tax=Streptomyces atratus TaxID=1893 RepID=UPI0015A6F916|nr:hypothetical protein [Streptomyces atratus]